MTDLMTPIFTAHSTDPWASMETKLDQWAADRCVICGGQGGPECASCTADWDVTVARSADL